MRWSILLVFILFITPLANAFIINESVEIQPNDTANGYYITNNSIDIDELAFNSTDASFISSSQNITAQSLYSNGSINETLCSNSFTCILTQIPFIKNILFSIFATTPEAAIEPENIGGGGSGGVLYDFLCEKVSCYGCNLKCVVKLKNMNIFPTNITASYTMFFDGNKKTMLKTYPLDAGQLKSFNEYFTVYNPSNSFLDQLSSLVNKQGSAKISADFSPYQTNKVALFDVKSLFTIYIAIFSLGIAGVTYYIFRKMKRKVVVDVDVSIQKT